MGLWLSAEGVLKGKRRTSRIVFDFKTKHWLSPAFVSSLQNWPYPPPVWIIKKWWNKPQVILYRNRLPRVGKVRTEILIINLYRSQQWRALLRVEKVKKELIGKNHTHKNSAKGWALRNVRAVPFPHGETRLAQFVLIMGWWDPIQSFRVIEVKQHPKRHFSVISVCTGPALMGVFLCTPAGRNLRNVTLWDTGPLVQCWPNDTNTPTKMCASFYPFWRFFTYVLPCLWFSIHAVLFVWKLLFLLQPSFC